MFVTIFILAFMTSDYLFTGSVTETWMGIAVIAGTLSGIVRWMIIHVLGSLVRSRQPSTR